MCLLPVASLFRKSCTCCYVLFKTNKQTHRERTNYSTPHFAPTLLSWAERMDYLTSTLPEVCGGISKWFIHMFKTQKVLHCDSFWAEGREQRSCWFWKGWEGTKRFWQQCHCPLLRALIPHDHFPISMSSVIIFAIVSSLPASPPASPPSVSPNPFLSYPICKSSLALEIRMSSLEFQCLQNHPLKVQAQLYITSLRKMSHPSSGTNPTV